MKKLTLEIPDELDAALAEIARARGIGKCALALEILLEYTERKRGLSSALDVLEDLSGTMDGPSDLSTNEAHLEDFGS